MKFLRRSIRNKINNIFVGNRKAGDVPIFGPLSDFFAYLSVKNGIIAPC